MKPRRRQAGIPPIESGFMVRHSAIPEEFRLQIVTDLRQLVESGGLPDKFLKAMQKQLKYWESVRGTN